MVENDAWPRPFVVAVACCDEPSGAAITRVTTAPLTELPLESATFTVTVTVRVDFLVADLPLMPETYTAGDGAVVAVGGATVAVAVGCGTAVLVEVGWVTGVLVAVTTRVGVGVIGGSGVGVEPVGHAWALASA